MRRFAALVLFALTPPLLAAERFDPEARARTVAPFLDTQTIAILRLDLTRLNLPALKAWFLATGKKRSDQIKEEMSERLGTVSWDQLVKRGKKLEQLGQAGVQELYLIFSLRDFPNAPFVMVPLPAGTDGKALQEKLRPILTADLLGWKVSWQVTTRGQTLLAGTAETLERLRTPRAAPRPEVAPAFAAAGDTSVQLLFLPTADLRRAAVEMFPTLPRALGDVSTQALAANMRWAAWGVDFPPQPVLRLVLQAPTKDAAQSLRQLLRQMGQAVSEQKAIHRLLSDADKRHALFSLHVTDTQVLMSLNADVWKTEIAALVARLFPAEEQAIYRQRRRVKQIILAMFNSMDAFGGGRLPAVANFDKKGKPLLSWRVHLLPFLEQQELYNQFHLNEPWDSAHNKKLLARMPAVYQGPNTELNKAGKTVFVVPSGPKTVFPGGPKGVPFPASIPDGTSNTALLVVVDADHAVPWTKPEDWHPDAKHPATGLERLAKGYLVGMADGSTTFLSLEVDPQFLKFVFDPNDGTPLPAKIFSGE